MFSSFDEKALKQRNYSFELDERIADPASFRVAFLIFLEGDLVMSPEHLGVAYMAAVLRRAGFDCTILEVVGDFDAALDSLATLDPNVTCFTVMSLNLPSLLAFSKKLRELLPKTRIICGGPAGTYAGMEILRRNPHVEIVAVGEGEPTIFELVQHIYLDLPLKTCPGIYFRDRDGELRQTPLRTLMHNLDDLPFPSRDQLELHGGKLEYIRISSSRGCVARCSFCSAPHAGNKIQPGKGWRGRSPNSVLDELEYLVGKYQFNTFDFVDSTFEDPDGGRIGKERIRAIAEGIIERGIRIYYNVCMRAENWSAVDAELLQLLFQSGLEKVNIGIESGTESELRLWQKRATVEDNVRIIKLLREQGIYLAMGFIQFHPYSTLETLRANALFLRNNAGHNLRRLTERMEIYPGTPLIERLTADGLLAEDYWDTLDHYAYRYKDDAVARVAAYFASLYNNQDYHEHGVITETSAVFEFETFNVVLSTYLSRLQRMYSGDSTITDLIAEFRRDLNIKHTEMSEFNFAFFTETLDSVLADRQDHATRRRDVDRIDTYFRDSINELKTRQLRLGRALIRAGANLSRINSTAINGPSKIYIGGGTPCW